MSIEIEASNVRIDGDRIPRADFEILLRFVCVFVVRVAGVEVFREVEFPFVEFASQVATWLRAGGIVNFDFESMDSTVRGLVYFHRIDGETWAVGSMLPESPPPIAVGNDELRRALDVFLVSVPTVIDAFGVDVRRFVERGAEFGNTN